MGARLDVVALLDDIECSDRLSPEIEFDRSNIVFTFVHFAVVFEDYDLLNEAIAQRADLDVRSYLSGSPLYIACDVEDTGMAQILLRNGAHADAVSFMSLAT